MVPVVPSRRARPWLFPAWPGRADVRLPDGVGDGWCQVLRGKGASTRELLQLLSSGSHTCREGEMGRHSWSCWSHGCQPITLSLGTPAQELLGTGSSRPFPAAQQCQRCCSERQGPHSRVPRVPTDAQAQGWHPPLTLGTLSPFLGRFWSLRGVTRVSTSAVLWVLHGQEGV